MIKQLSRVKKDRRLNNTLDLTLDEERSTVQVPSASYVDEIVGCSK